MNLTIPASQVRPGDVVIRDNGTEFRVHHVMTTGKKAQITTLSRLNDPAPWHTSPQTQVTIRREDVS